MEEMVFMEILDYLLMFFLAFVGIVFPIFNTEVTFVAMTYRENHLLVLAAAAAAGSTMGFMIFYYLGTTSRNFSKKLREKVEAIDITKFNRSSFLVLATSCLVSVPPCTPLVIAAGALRYHLKRLIPILLLFRMIKYTLLAYFLDTIHSVVQIHAQGVSEKIDTFLNHLNSIL